MRPILASVALALALALALGACGGGEEEEAGADARPEVMATSGFAADIARAVAGPGADVAQLIPDGSSPHTFSPSAKDRARLQDADLVVAVGAGYEQALRLDTLRAPTLALADHAGPLRALAGEAGARDPHVWMDPTRIARALPALVRALAGAGAGTQAGAGGRAGLERRAEAWAARLRALDRELRATLAAIPPARRKLVTSHDALGYFAERYGLRVVAAPLSAQPEAQASAEAVAATIAAVRRGRVPVVFAQRGDDPEVLRRVAQETGAEVVADLLVEAPGPEAPGYEDALRFDARRIAGALR